MKKKKVKSEVVEKKKRRRKKKTPAANMYFTKKTEDAIILFNKTKEAESREKIFRDEIAYPLDKLAENIINRFKFPYVNQSFEDLKRQVVSFLVINLNKFTQGKGKAFSYFSVIAKNYLILHNNTGYKQEKRSVYLSDKTEADIPVEDILNLENTEDAIRETHEETREFIKLMIEYWENNTLRVFKKKRDIDIANAVIELFRRVDSIENFNKKALYLMIREMTNCKTSYITKVVNKMRAHVVQHAKEYQNWGYIRTNDSQFFKYKK